MTRRWTTVIDPNEIANGRFVFFNNGTNVKNKWLDYEGSNITCFKTPGIIASPSALRALTYTNVRTGTDIDIEIYKNGVGAGQKVFVWQIRNAQCGYKTNGLDTISFAPGDKVRVFVKGVGVISSKPVISLGLLNTSGDLGEGQG